MTHPNAGLQLVDQQASDLVECLAFMVVWWSLLGSEGYHRESRISFTFFGGGCGIGQPPDCPVAQTSF
jgi:hypothetical protein